MLAEFIARQATARNIHYGWVMAALGFLYGLFASSALGVPSVLMRDIAADLHVSMSELSASQGLRFALFGLVAPFAGGMMLRYGPRVMLAIAGTMTLAGLLLTIVMTNRFEMWLGLGLILGIAPGLTALQLATIISVRWFTTHRGLVVGLLNGSVATGTLIFVPMGAWITEHWGWRLALVPSGLGLLLALILFLLLGKDRPQELGLASLGETAMAPIPAVPRRNFVALSFHGLRLASTRLVFWVLALTFLICGVSSYGLTSTHFVPFCGDLGLPAVTSAGLLAMIGVFDLIGTVGSGWLSDRFDNRWLLAIYYGFRGLSLIWLVESNATIVTMSAFAMLYGLDFIATVPPTVRLTVGTFGREMGPVVFGWIFAAHQLGVGLMAFAAGVSRDALGTYVPAFLFAGVLCLLAAAAFTLVKRPGVPAPA
ncbi:MFS transporter [Bradyrhizobium sp. WYCCWR 13023]|uniref:MFS transporter n=1 Tax=Bradyrhizobium zhengyangense TaxID=2911009 RepID=A0A9X1U7Z7_9BRAD|nr:MULTISPECIES: MFS transporter [Bradyrhizobium]MCG2625874.1 MFS transporter [Bradyrhizobium zhengyangense]MDA9520274.1 monocarboxylate transporter permease [Bradyrhizobium sp. CCBAU 11434]